MKLIFPIVTFSLFTACSSIKVETGQTQEEAVESAESQASIIRARFAEQINSAPPVDQAQILIDHIDTTAQRLLSFGHTVAREWRKGTAGRGETIEASEMREVVAAWTNQQEPILQAWEDNLEYGQRSVSQTRFFSSEFEESLSSLSMLYYQIYSVAIYPNGSIDEYETQLSATKSELDIAIENAKRKLAKYR